MEKEWNANLVLSKYHYSVCERLFENFRNYETKRFLSASIKEATLSLMHLINSLILYHNKKEKFLIKRNPVEIFKKIAESYYEKKDIENLLVLIKIEKDKKSSPVEILKGDNILYLVKGEYKTLTYNRLNELIGSLNNVIKNFPKN